MVSEVLCYLNEEGLIGGTREFCSLPCVDTCEAAPEERVDSYKGVVTALWRRERRLQCVVASRILLNFILVLLVSVHGPDFICLIRVIEHP